MLNMVTATSWVSVGYVSEEGTGHTPYTSKALLTTRIFNSRRKKRKRGSGKFIPDVWEPPGGRTGKGCEQQPPDRREGGLLLAPLGGAGENISRQSYCAPELRGRRGLNLVDMRYYRLR